MKSQTKHSTPAASANRLFPFKPLRVEQAQWITGSTLVQRTIAIVVALILLGVPEASAQPAVQEIDLGSDTAWQLNINGGDWRPIKVPAGGWNSDRQNPTLDFYQRSKTKIDRMRGHPDFKYAEYRREIEIPASASGAVSLIRFGAVNYVAEVCIDGVLVATHRGAMMPFDVDITDRIRPGGKHLLTVKCFGLTGHDVQCPTGFTYWTANEGSKFSLGITKSIVLVILPELYIKDLFVRTSVSNRNFSCKVWVRNASKTRRTLTVAGELTPWRGAQWIYPKLPAVQVEIEANSEKSVVLGPVLWDLGPTSYWWPNKPFREDYTATLHYVNLSIRESGGVKHQQRQRFGFVEYGEGPHYYTVNGIRTNDIGDATPESGMSEYDCYSLAPAFLPPSAESKGCPETWKRYMRMGMDINRIHQSTPTAYMMDAADETGFMLIPETGIRGQIVGRNLKTEILAQAERELATVCRNHPSVARYSLSNESGVDPDLVDAISEVDDTRPLTFEVNYSDGGRVDAKRAHAFKIVHYWPYPKPARSLYGVGEFAWRTDGMAQFADGGKDMRLNDIAYFSGWDWINYWPNFLEGMNHEKHAWRLNVCPDRIDGQDGWNSHIVDYVQRAFHPYAVFWRSLEKMNSYSKEWPQYTPVYSPGGEVKESVEVFNESFHKGTFSLMWEAHWDKPTGELYRAGTIESITIEPGCRASGTVAFSLPSEIKTGRRLWICISSMREGICVYSDNRFNLQVSTKAVKTSESTIAYQGTDSETGGNWRQRYGKEGYNVLFAEDKMPGYARLDWLTPAGKREFQAAQIKPDRLLEYFVNQGTDTGRAVSNQGASLWMGVTGTPMRFKLDLGAHPHQVAFYCYYPQWGPKQMITVTPERGSAKPVTVEIDVKKGSYAVFTLSGTVVVTLNCNDSGILNGIFFDPLP